MRGAHQRIAGVGETRIVAAFEFAEDVGGDHRDQRVHELDVAGWEVFEWQHDLADAADFRGARIKAHRHVGAKATRQFEQVGEGDIRVGHRREEAERRCGVGRAATEAGSDGQVLREPQRDAVW